MAPTRVTLETLKHFAGKVRLSFFQLVTWSPSMNNDKVHSKALKTRQKALGVLDHLVLLQKEENNRRR